MKNKVNTTFKRVLEITLLSLLVLIIGLFIYDYFRIKPNNVQFTNITSNSVTVSWDTKAKTSATAIYKKGNSKFPFSILSFRKQEFFDTRDITEAELEATQESIQNLDELEVTMNDIVTDVSVTNRGKYYTHHIEITGLDPETEYSFMVGDSILFRSVKDVNNKTVAKTYAVPESILTPIPAYGSVRDAMNQDDIPVEDMAIIDDGIVYFNFYDEVSGERSTVLSSTLNKNGNWYIDVSSAIDKNGNSFFNTYTGGEEGYIYAELKFNGGNLGFVSRTDNAGIISPAKAIILNSFLTKSQVNSSTMLSPIIEKFIKGVNAAESCGNGKGACNWVSWCEYECRALDGSKYYWEDTNNDGIEEKLPINNDCKEQTAILAARNCKGYESATDTENDFCSGNVKAGTKPHFVGTICRECNYHGLDYAHWKTVDSSECNSNTNDKNVKSESSCEKNKLGKWNKNKCECVENSSYNNSTGMCECKTNYKQISKECVLKDNKCTIKDGDTSILDNSTKNVYCDDCDGCYCSTSNNSNHIILNGRICKKESNGKEKDGNRPPLSNNGYCYDPDGCKCFQYLTSFDVNTGEYCSDDVFSYPKSTQRCLDADGCKGCTENTIVEIDNTCTITSTSLTQTDDECWVKGKKNLYKVENNICYNCENADWKQTDCGSDMIDENSCKEFINGNEKIYCYSHNSYCIKEKILYKCSFFGQQWKKAENDYTVSANGITEIAMGEKCTTPPCTCTSGPDEGKELYKVSSCREVETCTSDTKGKVCSKNGYTCPEEPAGTSWPCVSNSSSIILQNDLLSLFAKPSKVSAESVGKKDIYIIDQSTGLISGLEPGTYSFKNKGETYFFDISEESLKANNGNVLIFIDKNDNGEYDKDTDIKVSTLGSQIEITTIQKNYTYSLKEGFNFVSFPFVVAYDEYRTAASLLKQLNSVYGDIIYSISKFDGSWKVVGQNLELYDNNDFQLLPGQGYVIKAKEDIDIVIPGKPIKYESSEETAPIYLSQGWNLLGIYGTNVKSYTAKSMLQDINNFNNIDFTANNVTKWESDTQRYEGYQLNITDGVEKEYGFDYPIDILKSYFVRVENGTGNWQPELESK